MAEIAMRQYLAEIESLIEGSSYDEAIAHCRHILGTYPKHLEVYRLLGKAALEKEDDRAAVDLFQRILSVDPEDFVARVGLSIAYDRQGALDDALWQMERGFELMPSNDVIQSELRRLYGRRNGVEPERIAPTRGALARMYAQGDLYDEAIAELRALLKDAPDRIDLQVLLAETLWRDEQRNEAAAIAERVLEKLPYCLSANLILGEIWLNSGFSEDGEMLLRRAQAVDPDNVRATTLLGPASPLSEQTTGIQRLEYQPQIAPAAEPAADEVPEWLAGLAGLALEQPEEAALPGLPEPAPAAPADTEIPDWLRSVDQAVSESAAESAEAPVDEAPDWMSAPWQQAPVAADESALAEPAEAGPTAPESEAVPDWLSQLGGLETGESVSTELPEPAVADEEGEAVPDWLSRIGESPAEEAEEVAELPDWLSALDAAPAEPAQAEEPLSELAQAEMPDWLQTLRPQESESGVPAVELPEVDESEIPDWMAELQQTQAADEALDFLQRLSEGVQLESTEAEAPPDVLPPMAEEQPAAGVEVPTEPAPEPSETRPTPPAAPTEMAAMPSADEALAFLQSLTIGKEEELRAQAEQEAQTRLSDIMGREPVAPAPAQPPSPPELPVAEEPIEPPPTPSPEPATRPLPELDQLLSPDEALAFLQSLTIGKEEELRAQAERAGEERMEAIMGGKPGTSPLRPRAQPEPEQAAEEAPSAEESAEPEMSAPVVAAEAEVGEEALAEAVPEIDFWLQTADDEGGEPIAADYFERAATAQPAAPAAPKAERMARPAMPPVEPETAVAPVPLPVGAAEFESRLETDPADHEARLGLARVWWASGDRDQSLQLYQHLIEKEMFVSEVAADLQRDLETHKHADWYRTLGDAQMKLGNLAHALDAYRQALTHL